MIRIIWDENATLYSDKQLLKMIEDILIKHKVNKSDVVFKTSQSIAFEIFRGFSVEMEMSNDISFDYNGCKFTLGKRGRIMTLNNEDGDWSWTIFDNMLNKCLGL